MDLIVAIDIIDGEVVRLNKGVFETKRVYSSRPVEVAQSIEGVGLTSLHLIDLDGAKTGRVVNLTVLEEIAKATDLVIDVGGGIRSEEDLRRVFDAGAAKANLGSVAVTDRERVASWIAQWGAERFILAADAQDGLIKSGGWLEGSSLTLENFIDSYLELGLVQVACTDINRDGMLSGPAFGLYRSLLESRPILKLVASGGVSSLEDLTKLSTMGLTGAIIGKALYEGRFTLEDLGRLQEDING